MACEIEKVGMEAQKLFSWRNQYGFEKGYYLNIFWSKTIRTTPGRPKNPTIKAVTAFKAIWYPKSCTSRLSRNRDIPPIIPLYTILKAILIKGIAISPVHTIYYVVPYKYMLPEDRILTFSYVFLLEAGLIDSQNSTLTPFSFAFLIRYSYMTSWALIV